MPKNKFVSVAVPSSLDFIPSLFLSKFLEMQLYMLVYQFKQMRSLDKFVDFYNGDYQEFFNGDL